MELKIRPMTAADKPVIMQILKDIPEFLPMEVVVAEEVIDLYLKDSTGSGYHTCVAEVESEIMGYVCYGPTPLTEGTWDIYWIATNPRSQGKGVGRALIEFAEEKIRQSNGRLVFIETASKPEYEKTRRFHYSRGYEMVSQIHDFYAPGDHKMIFQKKIK